MYVPMLKLYHCNTKSNINKAILTKDYSILQSFHDKYWIGDGIYFWDNLSNAKYWKHEKERKSFINNGKMEFDIGYGLVRLEKTLDLTDSDVRKKLEKIFIELYKVNPNFKDMNFGEKINCFFEVYPNIKSEYDVIKAHGHYPSQKTKLYSFHRYKVGLTPQVKTIYNVINNTAIIEFKKEVN